MHVTKLRPSDFEKTLIQEYFRQGSINKVFQNNRYSLPISFAGFDRLLTKFKVVKSAGPNSKLSESLYILGLLASYKIPLEKIYHQHLPHSIQVSTNTLHRILHYMRLGLTRRRGVALLISPQDDPQKILIGKDLSLTNSGLGNKGDFSLPMGHSKTGEPISLSIARVLQNEVFTQKVIDGEFPWKMIPKHPAPVMFINIADIQVAVYKVVLPTNYSDFSSYKLTDPHYYNLNHLPHGKYRPGVKEIIEGVYLKSSRGNHNVITAEINNLLFAPAERPLE